MKVSDWTLQIPPQEHQAVEEKTPSTPVDKFTLFEREHFVKIAVGQWRLVTFESGGA